MGQHDMSLRGLINPLDPPEEFDSAEQVSAFMTKAVSQVFRTASYAGHQARNDPYGLSISAVGRCTKQAAYRLARTDPSDPELSWDIESMDNYAATRPDLAGQKVGLGYNGRAARLGTWLHEGFLAYLVAALGGSGDPDAESECWTEQEVTLKVGDDEIDGHLDFWWPSRGVVGDLKTLSDWLANKVRGNQSAFPEHRIQVGLYALALHQSGHRPKWVCWVYLDRETGEPTLVTEPWNAEYLTDVTMAVRNVQAWRNSPDLLPNPKRGPGISYECDSCPWLRRCWGEQARPGKATVQSSLVKDAPQIAEVWQQYQAINAQLKELEEEKKFLRAVAEPHGPGVYPTRGGGGIDVSYTKPSKNFNTKKALTQLSDWAEPEAGRTFDPDAFYTEGKGKLLVRAAKPEPTT